ncbi:hypothetical protein B296_00002739 [Ensete ventricosum]|uniref:Uncharacterized protein n=1 Tax=Ensete ventricosum TaxID=4639 RepID=A0A427AXY0_ENSVE|nr:hypothetical protein B296_00002739 [Ensete ventricosum]
MGAFESGSGKRGGSGVGRSGGEEQRWPRWQRRARLRRRLWQLQRQRKQGAGAAERGGCGCKGRWQRPEEAGQQQREERNIGGRRRKRQPRERAVATCGYCGRKGGKEDYGCGSSGWKSRRKQRRLEERAAVVVGSWQRRQAMGRRRRRRTTTTLAMGAGGRRPQPAVKDGRGGRLSRQGRQRRGLVATRQQSPTRAAVEESARGLVGGDSGREAREEGSAGGEREMVASSRSKGRRRAWLRQRRLQ